MPPGGLKFILDEHVSPKLASLLRTADLAEVTTVKDRGWNGTPDKDWIPRAVAGGSIIVTGDRNEKTREVRVEDFAAMNANVFFLGGFFGELGIWEQIKWFVANWEAICKKAAELRPGECVVVFKNGKMKLYSDCTEEDHKALKGQPRRRKPNTA